MAKRRIFQHFGIIGQLDAGSMVPGMRACRRLLAVVENRVAEIVGYDKNHIPLGSSMMAK
jgi:hypothetical protein